MMGGVKAVGGRGCDICVLKDPNSVDGQFKCFTGGGGSRL